MYGTNSQQQIIYLNKLQRRQCNALDMDGNMHVRPHDNVLLNH